MTIQHNLGLIILLISCFLSCAQAPKREKTDTNLQAKKEEEKSVFNQKSELKANDSTAYYAFLISFHSDSYGQILINGLPVAQKTKEEFEKAVSKQLNISDFLVNGTNTIELVGDLQNSNGEIFKANIGEFPNQGTPVQINFVKENHFTFGITDISKKLWDTTEHITTKDFSKLKLFALKRDNLIKNSKHQSYIEMHKTCNKHLLSKSYYPPGTTLKDIENDCLNSFNSLKDKTKYEHISFTKDELQCFVSHSGKIAAVRVQGTKIVTCFENKETGYDWCWKTYYIKKDGKFIPIYL